jgi:hypothetical protein
VWVYVGLGWEHKELDGNKIISMGIDENKKNLIRIV